MNDLLLKEVLDKVMSSIDTSPDAYLPTRAKIAYGTVVSSLILHEHIDVAAKSIGLTTDSLQKICSRYLKLKFPSKTKSVLWRNYFLGVAGYKVCIGCKQPLSISYFSKNCSEADGLSRPCKECKAKNRAKFTENNPDYNCKTYQANKSEYIARAIKYTTRRAQATANWADIQKLRDFYAKCPQGYHVDHIIPLQGDLVCGLHVETNLQYLPAVENLRKSNKYTVV